MSKFDDIFREAEELNAGQSLVPTGQSVAPPLVNPMDSIFEKATALNEQRSQMDDVFAQANAKVQAEKPWYDRATDSVASALAPITSTVGSISDKVEGVLGSVGQGIADRFGTGTKLKTDPSVLKAAGIDAPQGDFISENVKRLITEGASAFGEHEWARDYYEKQTGRKYYDDAELNEIEDPALRREIAMRQRDSVNSFVHSAGELAVAIPRVAVSAVAGGIKAWDEGEGIIGGAKNLATTAGKTMADLSAATVSGFGETLGSPNDKLTNDPFGFITDAYTFAGLGAVGKVAGAGVKTGIKAGATSLADAAKFGEEAARLSNGNKFVSPETYTRIEELQKLAQAAEARGLLDTARAVAKPIAKGTWEAAKELSPVPLTPLSYAGDQLRKRFKPTAITSNALTEVLRGADSPRLNSAAQIVLDARAGVPAEVLNKIESLEVAGNVRKGQLSQAIEAKLKNIPDEERPLLRDILAGERTRAVMPNWIEQIRPLRKALIAAMDRGLMTEDDITRAFDIGGDAILDLDAKLKDAEIFTGMKPSKLYEVIEARDIDVWAKTIDGLTDAEVATNLATAKRLLNPSPFDPNSVIIRPNPKAPLAIQAMVAKHIDALTELRQITIDLGKDSTGIRVGPKPEQVLMKDRLYQARTAYYTPDVYAMAKKVKPLTEEEVLAARQRTLQIPVEPIVGDKVGGLGRFSKLKNKLSFEKRKAMGASDDLMFAYTDSSRKAVNDIQRYKLLEFIDDAGYASDVPMPGYTRVPNTPIPGTDQLTRFGAISGKYINSNLLQYLTKIDQTLLTPRTIERIAMNTRRAFGGAKVAMNFASHDNNMVGNFTGHIVDGGLIGAASYPVAILKELGEGLTILKDEKSPMRHAAMQAGVIADNLGDTLTEFEKLDKETRAFGAEVGTSKYETNSLLRAAEDVSEFMAEVYSPKKDDAWYKLPGFYAGKLLQGADNASRMAYFNRFIKRMSRETKTPVAQLIKSPDVLAQAKAHIEQFHANYDHVPTGVTAADKVGALPFSRYGFSAAKMLMNLPATNPVLSRNAVNKDRQNYDEMSEAMRMRQDLAPRFRNGRTMPLNETKDLNMSGLVPYTTSLKDFLNISERGAFNEEQYEPETSVSWVPGGIPGNLGMIAYGIDPLTQSKFKPDLPYFEQGTATRALADLLLPGMSYHLGKVKNAYDDKPDARGRVMKTGDAIAHAAGIKVEDSNPADVVAGVDAGIKKRMIQLDKERSAELNGISNLVGASFEERFNEIILKYKALEDQIGDNRATLLKRRQ